MEFTELIMLSMRMTRTLRTQAKVFSESISGRTPAGFLQANTQSSSKYLIFRETA